MGEEVSDKAVVTSPTELSFFSKLKGAPIVPLSRYVTYCLDKVVQVACGGNHSIVVTKSGMAPSFPLTLAHTRAGKAYAFGLGEDYRLSTGEEDAEHVPVEMKGKQLEDKKVLLAATGESHSILLAQ